MDVKIVVRGLPELRRAFAKVDESLPRELKVRFLKIAELVAGHARSRAPHLTGRAQSSIKARGSTRGASIAFGGTAAPYYAWLDFGGRVGRNRSIQRDMIPGGRYVYPAIAEQSKATAQAAEDAVNDVARKAGFETRTGF